MNVSPIQKASATTKVFKALYEMIASGRYPRGQKHPPQEELARQFGGSRNTLREAVNQLSAMGLLSSQQGVGTVVEPPSPGGYLSSLNGQFLLDPLSVREFIEARICIERNAVRLAVARAGAEDVERLRTTLEHQRRALKRGDTASRPVCTSSAPSAPSRSARRSRTLEPSWKRSRQDIEQVDIGSQGSGFRVQQHTAAIRPCNSFSPEPRTPRPSYAGRLQMDLKPDFNRFLAAVHHKETDRVPLGEILIDYSIQSKFLDRPVSGEDLASQVEFWAKAGYDYIPITVSMMSPGKVTEESKITKVLKEMVLREKPGTTDPKAWNLEFTSFIHEQPDLDKFPWEAAADIDFSKLHAAKKLLPEGMKVIAISGKIFTLTWMLMGFNNFALKLVLDEALVAEVFERVATIQFKALETIFGMDHVAGVWAVDDIAFGTGPMISPAALQKHVFHWYKKVADNCHDHNRIFLMHSDGDLSMLMDDLIAMGLDVIQPIDPSCMDMAKVKKRWGDRICLIGNVSNELLRSASTQEIEARVKELLRDAAPGGGFCPGSGNSVPNWAKFENYMAMREACLKHGAYPIRM